MYRPFLDFIDPLLRPTDRVRVLCLLLLATLVTALLYAGSQPVFQSVIPNPPWDKLAHATAFGGFAGLAWVVFGGRYSLPPVVAAFVIALLDEGMQYYTPGRTADVGDIVADLIGAVLGVLMLRTMRARTTGVI